MNEPEPLLINKILNWLTYITAAVLFVWIWSDDKLKNAVIYLVACGVGIWILSFLMQLPIMAIDKAIKLEERSSRWNFRPPWYWWFFMVLAGFIQLGFVAYLGWRMLPTYQ